MFKLGMVWLWWAHLFHPEQVYSARRWYQYVGGVVVLLKPFLETGFYIKPALSRIN
jgi:hypothetical protein